MNGFKNRDDSYSCNPKILELQLFLPGPVWKANTS